VYDTYHTTQLHLLGMQRFLRMFQISGVSLHKLMETFLSKLRIASIH